MNYETNYSEISTNQGKSNPCAAIDRDTDLATLLRSGMFVQTMGGKYGVVAGDKIVFQDGTFTERKCLDDLLYVRNRDGAIVRYFSIGAVYSANCRGFDELRDTYIPVLWSRTLV